MADSTTATTSKIKGIISASTTASSSTAKKSTGGKSVTIVAFTAEPHSTSEREQRGASSKLQSSNTLQISSAKRSALGPQRTSSTTPSSFGGDSERQNSSAADSKSSTAGGDEKGDQQPPKYFAKASTKTSHRESQKQKSMATNPSSSRAPASSTSSGQKSSATAEVSSTSVPESKTMNGTSVTSSAEYKQNLAAKATASNVTRSVGSVAFSSTNKLAQGSRKAEKSFENLAIVPYSDTVEEKNKTSGTFDAEYKQNSTTKATTSNMTRSVGSVAFSSTKQLAQGSREEEKSSENLAIVPYSGTVEEEKKQEEFIDVFDAWSPEEVDKVVTLWKLTDTERHHLTELGERLRDVSHWKNTPKDVVRFLKARPRSVKAAEHMFRKMIQWRLENKVDTFLQDYKPPRLIRDYVPGAILVGTDKDGDPIYAERIGSVDSPEMVHRFGSGHLIKHAIWIRETIATGSWIDEYERKHGRPVCQILVVEDLQGLSVAHLDRKLLSAFQEITRLDQDNYPEAAKKLININAPFIFRLAWSLVKHFFDHNVAEKMVFVAPGHSEEVLRQYLDLKVLPRELVPEGEGRAARGLPPNFRGGPLPPSQEGDEFDYDYDLGEEDEMLASDMKGRATESSGSRGFGADDGETVRSTRSGHSLWSNGPVRKYMHKKQVEKQKKKEEEIKGIREICARRLRPQELSPTQAARLRRLREAKYRRGLSDDGSFVDDASSTSGYGAEKKSLSEGLTDRVQKHGRMTRFFVMTFLVFSFFVLLHPELFEIAFGYDLVGEPSSVWWHAILQGVALLCYMLVCTAVHFLTCDFALVYAYNALDLGSKTGRDVKKLYSDKVRLVVAAISFGIFALGIGKAVADILFSVVVERVTVWHRQLSGLLAVFAGKVSEAAGIEWSICEATNYYFNDAMGIQDEGFSAPRSAADEAAQRIFELAESAHQAAEVAKTHISSWTNCLWVYMNVGTVDKAVATWQLHAFQTARLLFSYTAVFLLVFLVLFNYASSTALLKTRALDPKAFKTLSGASTPPSSPTAATTESDEDVFHEDDVHSQLSMQSHSSSNAGAIVRTDSKGRRKKPRFFKRQPHRPVLGAVKESEASATDSVALIIRTTSSDHNDTQNS